MSKYYNIEGNKAVKKYNECPQCGTGFFMAKHSDRESCGKCGHTQFEGSTKGKKRRS